MNASILIRRRIEQCQETNDMLPDTYPVPVRLDEQVNWCKMYLPPLLWHDTWYIVIDSRASFSSITTLQAHTICLISPPTLPVAIAAKNNNKITTYKRCTQKKDNYRQNITTKHFCSYTIQYTQTSRSNGVLLECNEVTFTTFNESRRDAWSEQDDTATALWTWYTTRFF